MKSMISIATVLSLACATASAGGGNISFTGSIFEPTAKLDVSRIVTNVDHSPYVASIRLSKIGAKDRLAHPLLDYFVGYLTTDPFTEVGASLVEVVYR